MSAKDKLVTKQRARIVAFGDLGIDPEALRATSFVEVGPNAKDSNRLEDRVGEVPFAFRGQVPASIGELTARWDGGQAERINSASRRLVILGPDIYPWNVLGDSWGQTVWLPSRAGNGLDDHEFKTIISCWVDGIQPHTYLQLLPVEKALRRRR